MDVREYPFFQYYNEDKSHYKKASEYGYNDPFDHFLIGESGGFLLNIDSKYKLINTDLLRPAAIEYETNKRYTCLLYTFRAHET